MANKLLTFDDEDRARRSWFLRTLTAGYIGREKG
jgi:hypothetical protein